MPRRSGGFPMQLNGGLMIDVTTTKKMLGAIGIKAGLVSRLVPRCGTGRFYEFKTTNVAIEPSWRCWNTRLWRLRGAADRQRRAILPVLEMGQAG